MPRRDSPAPEQGECIMKSILRTCTALTLAASFGGQVMAQEMLQSLGAGEGEVSIVAWAGYLERGETVPPCTRADTLCEASTRSIRSDWKLRKSRVSEASIVSTSRRRVKRRIIDGDHRTSYVRRRLN